jgi:hypothetical protein
MFYAGFSLLTTTRDVRGGLNGGKAMSDGASDLIDLYEMPTDAYKALKAVDPNHDLCKLYEDEWFNKGNKPGIAARFWVEHETIAGIIMRFTDAMQEAVRVAEGHPAPPTPEVTLPADTIEVFPESTPSPPITW